MWIGSSGVDEYHTFHQLRVVIEKEKFKSQTVSSER